MIEFSALATTKLAAKLDVAAERRFIVMGDIVTMNDTRDVVPGGRLCLADRSIVAVLQPDDALPAGFESAPVVDTGGTIYPGLFDLHNHMPYNMTPLWQVKKRYDNRLEWQNHTDEYYSAVTAPFKLLNEKNDDPSFARAIVRFVECKGLFGGVTTGHGMNLRNKTMYEGLMRNIEQPLAAELPVVKSQTADFNDEKLAEMLAWTRDGQPYIYHLSEGLGAYGAKVFKFLEQAPGGLNAHLTCIHCVGIPAEGWDALTAVAGIVWSPTSNLLLYGQTCDVRQAKQRGIPVAIGADWSPSGCKNLLGELKVARAASQHMGGVLSDADLVAAVTCVPARMVGWDSRLGSLQPGKWADLLILEDVGGDHFARLVSAKETSVRAVVIDGRVRMGEAGGLVIADPLSSEDVVIGGKHYVIDLADPGTGGLGGLKLSDAIDKIRYGLAHLPELEQEHAKLALMGVESEDLGFCLEDEMMPERLSSILRRGNTPPARPMELSPMTSVDDAAFRQAMLDSLNMPPYAKAAFKES